MQKISNLKLSVLKSEDELVKKACKEARVNKDNLKYFKILKKSLDARDKNNLQYVYTVELSTKAESQPLKSYARVNRQVNVLVVGAGPAGLFCALDLLRHGINVTLIERGEKVEDRIKTVNAFAKHAILNEESNVQFGEGGAGAFSDGKLNTQTGSEFNYSVLQDFVDFGAPEEILYLSKPHIGSDNLPTVVKNIRNELLRLGGKILYNTKFTDFTVKNGKIHTVTYGEHKNVFDDVVLAVGHSARDVYALLHQKGAMIEAKEFAVGFRIEHLKEQVNLSQYGEKFYRQSNLPTADYKLTSSFDGRGVFTFCMCPGGVVIPSSSQNGTIVVNGMSEYRRNGNNSNSAVIVQAKLGDFDGGIFGGMKFQENLEKTAFKLGGENYCAPVQRVGDYLKNVKTENFGSVIPSYSIGTKMCNLNGILPNSMNLALKYALTDMSKKIKCFADYDAVLTAVETRTSSPVRIIRDKDYASVTFKNLYPCGEGCGYAGGITSAGADGKKVARAIISKYS